jgi:prolyl oligopeptidase
LLWLFSFSCRSQKLDYPIAKKYSTEDVYHGMIVKDPYRWLEYDSLPETKEWIKQQNEFSGKYLRRLSEKYVLENQLKKNSYFDFASIYRSGSYYFDFKIMLWGNPATLFIKKKMSSDGDIIVEPEDYKGKPSIKNFAVSLDNKYLAFSLSYKGSDWQEIRIKQIGSKKELPEVLKWVKFTSIEWDKNGFYYTQYPKPPPGKELTAITTDPKVFYHRLGTGQEEDSLIYHNNLRNFNSIDYQTFDKGRFFVVYTDSVFEGRHFKFILFKDKLSKSDLLHKLWIYPGDRGYSYKIIGYYKNKFLVFTNAKAPNGKLILIDSKFPYAATNFIPEYKQVLDQVNILGDKVIGVYLNNVDNQVIVFDSVGSVENKIEIPIGSTVKGFDFLTSDSTTLFYIYSFLYPPIVYQLNIHSLKTTLIEKTSVNYEFMDFEMRKIYYTSKDGTQIPMLIACKKKMKLNGKNPTILYGYGGFGVVRTPFYSRSFISFLENNGIIALACIRGGGEYGKEWHEEGSGKNKQNGFDDFIAAADYLVEQNYTSRNKLALMGGSNGGLLVGAVINQRPDICKVAIAEVGVYDMLRYHKYTIGRAWEKEYGNSEDSLQFKYLIKYSPLHNVKDSANYPATFIITSDHDDRVVPMHSYKMVATLQEKNKGTNPILLITSKDAGHSNYSLELDKFIYSFIYSNLNISPNELPDVH